ncbi:MAG: chorismate mutase [Pseudomonas sp.]
MNNEEIMSLRKEIDSLDEDIIRALALRFTATEKVGIIKATQNFEAVDRSREAEQSHKYSVLANRHGVSVNLIQKIFRMVIDEVVVSHRATREDRLASIKNPGVGDGQS